MKCSYCNKGFSCGCQKTRAANGKTVHKQCLGRYNMSTKNKPVNSDSLTSSINKARSNILNRRV